MSLLNVVASYSTYNRWANQKLIDWLKTLNQEILHTETASSFKTIIDTIEHLNKAQLYWLLFVLGKDISEFDWNVVNRNVIHVFQDLIEVSKRMEMDFFAFDESQLTQKLQFTSRQNHLSRYEYIMHVINHGTFHRGQIITMARSLGVIEGIPKTDYLVFVSERE